jgi:hypothetical protein
MNPDDAQTSLDDIRRLQDRTRDEYVRHGFSRPYLLASALVLFIAFASFDLPAPWGTTAVTSGVGLALGLLVVHQHRAPVRRRPTGPELLFYAGASAGLIVVYVAFSVATAIADLKFDLPAPHTVAAAALALTTLLCANPARRVFESTVRR